MASHVSEKIILLKVSEYLFYDFDYDYSITSTLTDYYLAQGSDLGPTGPKLVSNMTPWHVCLSNNNCGRHVCSFEIPALGSILSSVCFTVPRRDVQKRSVIVHMNSPEKPIFQLYESYGYRAT